MPKSPALLVRRSWQAATRPLTLSQVMSSVAGAGAMFIGAGRMEPDQFVKFALFTLVSSILLGVNRASLFQPALIYLRQDPGSFVPARYALQRGLGSGVIFVAVAWWLGTTDPWALLLLGLSTPFPILHDWVRFRGISLDRRWTVAQSDAIRVLLIPAAFAVDGLLESAVAFQTFLAFSTAVPLVFALIRLPKISRWIPFRRYAGPALMQLVDFGFGQTLIALPLLLLGNAAQTALIGGVRLAQSLLGPLNLASAAATTNLVADGATRSELDSAQDLIARGRSLGRVLAIGATFVVSAAILIVWISGFSLRGVANGPLLVGIALVGAALVTSGWTGVSAIVLRLLGQQGTVTLGRAIIAVLTVSGFGTGFLLGGTDLSLRIGFITLGIAGPAVFLTMNRIYFGRIGSARRASLARRPRARTTEDPKEPVPATRSTTAP